MNIVHRYLIALYSGSGFGGGAKGGFGAMMQSNTSAPWFKHPLFSQLLYNKCSSALFDRSIIALPKDLLIFSKLGPCHMSLHLPGNHSASLHMINIVLLIKP